jgi:hypothetical protein
VEPGQDFRRDRRRPLSLRHAKPEQARQRCVQTLADGLPLPQLSETYSIGPYGNGVDGTFSLADARCERDKAKGLLKEGKDPSTAKQLDKHRQAAARTVEALHRTGTGFLPSKDSRRIKCLDQALALGGFLRVASMSGT